MDFQIVVREVLVVSSGERVCRVVFNGSEIFEDFVLDLVVGDEEVCCIEFLSSLQFYEWWVEVGVFVQYNVLFLGFFVEYQGVYYGLVIL